MARKPAIMIQGTGSDVGKSLIVAGLARAFARRGLAVRPFKPQNMSNNAAVAAEGGEIGRAQALQARAAFVAPSVHMNPVLLKPQGETGAQVVVQGRVLGAAKAADYHRLKPELLARVLESFARLETEADLLLIEGAGSPAEINLREGDIANMGFAEAADLPVALVGDIARGGVIASLLGTALLLAPPERARLKGFIVNRFRGDPALFAEGLGLIEAKTGLSRLGLVPWFEAARLLPAEDSASLDDRRPQKEAAPIRIVVPRLPRIANFDDLDPLRAEADVEVILARPGEALPGDADLVLLPGSKASIDDLRAFREAGWDIDLHAHIRRGGHVLGLCGGYQILGRSIADPAGIEGRPGTVAGLGHLDVATELRGEKTVRAARGRDLAAGHPLSGYEIHLGRSDGPDCARPMIEIEGRPDGAVSADGRVMGCYLHGIFAADAFRHAFLSRLRRRPPGVMDFEARIEGVLDALAAHLERHVALERIWEIANAR